MSKQKIPFMAKVRDKVTGITGTVTAYLVYHTGCVQYEVKFLGKDKDAIKEYWLDEECLEVLDEPKEDAPAKAKKPNGGPSRGPSNH